MSLLSELLSPAEHSQTVGVDFHNQCRSSPQQGGVEKCVVESGVKHVQLLNPPARYSPWTVDWGSGQCSVTFTVQSSIPLAVYEVFVLT